MNPTKEETDAVLRQYVTDKTFYRDLAAHNATQNKKLARELVSDYRRRADDLAAPNHAQMQSAVSGGERYDFHRVPLARRVLRWLKKWSDKT